MKLKLDRLQVVLPFDVISLKDIKLSLKLNEHGLLTFRCLVEQEKANSYMKKASEDEVKVYDIGGKSNKKIFSGKISELSLVYDKGVKYLDVECQSNTASFDVKKNSRTFCDTSATYTEVIDKALKDYTSKSFRDNLSCNATIGDFILQYNETDWEFIKRLVSQFGSVLIPDCTSDKGEFDFGFPYGGSVTKIESDDYEVSKCIDEYNHNEATGLQENYVPEYIKYTVKTKKVIALGGKVTYQDMDFVVGEAQAETINDEIFYIYKLVLKSAARTSCSFNSKIAGMSLAAKVKQVKGNNISVSFDIDKDDGNTESGKFFTYAIESSSWYCMPEVGSEVHIYFPTGDEKDAIAVHALRNTSSSGQFASKTSNPSVKSFSNSSGSEVSLSGSDINFTSDGGGASTAALTMDGCINITAKKINITTPEDISLGGGADGNPETVYISAAGKITLNNNSTLAAELGDQLFVQGTKIAFDASEKSAAEIPDEILHNNDGMQDEIDNINSQAKAYEEQKMADAVAKTKKGIFAAVVGAVAVAAAAVVTVATGGLGAVAAVAIVAGVTSFACGASLAAEGVQDYKKAVQSGDFSQSYNFMRDSVMGGNQTLFDLVTNGAVLVSGVCIALLGGAGAVDVMKNVGMDMAQDVVGNLVSDYCDDGSINNGFMSYFESACMSGSMSGMSMGLAGTLEKGYMKASKVEGLTRCDMQKFQFASGVFVDTLSTYGMGGDVDMGQILLSNYISSKFTYSDPIDGATGSFHFPAVDFVLEGLEGTYHIERIYESINPRTGLFGKGWTTSLETCLQLLPDTIHLLCEDGHIETFQREDGKWVNNKGGAKIYELVEERASFLLKDNSTHKTFHFDRYGRPEWIEDRNGNRLTYTYDGIYIRTITTYTGYQLFLTYQDRLLVRMEDSIGRKIQYKYDGVYLTDVIHTDEGVMHYEYNDNGYISAITDQNGNTFTKNVYGDDAKVIRQDFQNGDCCDVTYEKENSRIYFRYRESGKVECSQYNADHQVIREIFEDGTTNEYGYDSYGNCNYERDRRGFETKKVFDAYGCLLEEVHPDGGVDTFEYSENHDLIRQYGTDGNEKRFERDTRGNIIKESISINEKDWKTVSYTYDRHGRKRSSTDALGNVTKYEYETVSLEGKQDVILTSPSRVTMPDGTVFGYSYDAAGRNTSITTDYGTVYMAYNTHNYPTVITDALGNVTLKSYNHLGKLIRLVTPNLSGKGEENGLGYSYEYDFLERELRKTDPLGNVSAKIRDSLGQVMKEIDPRTYDAVTGDGSGIEYVYDKDGRQIKTIYPDGGVKRQFYDRAGNVIKQISPEYYHEETDDGAGFCYEYDACNRLIKVTGPDNTVDHIYEYSYSGQLIRDTNALGETSSFVYDRCGNLLKKWEPAKKDEDGNQLYKLTKYAYDFNGNKVAEYQCMDYVGEGQDSDRYLEILFGYDALNRLISVSDKSGARAKYRYNCLNQKTYESFRISDSVSRIVEYQYDSVGCLQKKTEHIQSVLPKKNGTHRFVEKQFRNTMQTLKKAVTTYKYDANRNLVREVSPEGYETDYLYDEADRLIEIHEYDYENDMERTKTVSYDEAGNVIRIQEYQGKDAGLVNRRMSREYDYTKRAESRSEARKAERSGKLSFIQREYRYDAAGRMNRYTDPCGNITRILYDKNGRVAKEVLPEQYHAETDDGAGTVYRYNSRDQLCEVVNALGETVEKTAYDVLGNRKSVTDGAGNRAEFAYDSLGRLAEVATPEAGKQGKKSQTYSYDARGNITGIIDGNGNSTCYELDKWGRITKIVFPDGNAETYQYDYAGNIIKTTDAGGGTITYTYNSQQKVTCITDQEGNSEYFEYDGEGRQIYHLDRNDAVTESRYNMDKKPVSIFAYHTDEAAFSECQKGKKKQAERPDFSIGKDGASEKAETVSFEKMYQTYQTEVIHNRYAYNGDGTLAVAENGETSYQYGYTRNGQLEKKLENGRLLFAQSFNRNGQLSRVQDGVGNISCYEYDGAGRMKRIADGSGRKLVEYTYTPAGAVASASFGNGIQTEYSEDGDGNRKSMLTRNAEGMPVLDYEFMYDGNANRIRKTGSGQETSYEYDNRNRLTRYECRAEENKDSFLDYTSVTQLFQYDRTGNRVAKTTDGMTETYSYNAKNQLMQILSLNGKKDFSYDLQGNIMKETSEEGNRQYTYDSLNRTASVHTEQGELFENAYDAEGLRWRIQENGQESRFVFHGTDVLYETDGEERLKSTFARAYGFGGNDIVSAEIAEDGSAAAGRFYYH